MPLDLHVQHVIGVDDAARLFLRRLLARGAVLVAAGGERAEEIVFGAGTPAPDSTGGTSTG